MQLLDFQLGIASASLTALVPQKYGLCCLNIRKVNVGALSNGAL